MSNLQILNNLIDEALKTIATAEKEVAQTKQHIDKINEDVWNNEILPILKPYGVMLNKLKGSKNVIMVPNGIAYFNKSSQYINTGASYNYLTSNNILYLGGMPCKLISYDYLDNSTAEKSSVDYLIQIWNEVKPKMISSIEEGILQILKNKCAEVNKEAQTTNDLLNSLL